MPLALRYGFLALSALEANDRQQFECRVYLIMLLQLIRKCGMNVAVE